MRYKPKSVAALQIALGGLPHKMRVELDPDISVSAKPSANVKASKASVTTRLAPKL